MGPWIGFLCISLKFFGPISLTAEQAADLTAGGKVWVHAERDVLLYICFTAALVGVLFFATWSRWILDTSRCRPAWIPVIGFVCGLLPPLLWSSLKQSSDGYIWCALFALAAIGHTGICLLKGARRDLPGGAPLPQPAEEGSKAVVGKASTTSRWGIMADASIPLFIFLLIYIPDPTLLAGRFFQIEEFFHWNGFVMTGAMAFKHGLAIYKDFIPVYGPGWPVLFGSFAHNGPVSYSSIIPVSICVSVLYFFGAYILLTWILRSRVLAAAICIFATVALSFPGFEPENKSIIWRWIGGFPMRGPTEIAFFLFLWRYVEDRTTKAAVLCGIAAALTLFFSIDLGVFVTAALVAFWCYVLAFARRDTTLRQGLLSLGAFWVTAVSTFLFATRGTLFSRETFANIFDYIARSCSGMGLVPFADLKPGWVFAFSIIATILFGLSSAAILRPQSERHLHQAFAFIVSLYSLERLVQFMGRTMWHYLIAVAVPILLAVATLLRISGVLSHRHAGSLVNTKQPHRSTVRLAIVPTVSAVIWFFSSPDLPNYPAVWNPKARAELRSNTLPLLPDSSDVTGIPAQYQPYLASIAQLTERLRTLRAEGNRIQILDACSTTFYTLADLPPFGMLYNEMDHADISKKEISRLVRDIIERGPDFIVLNEAPFPWPRALCQEAWQASREALFAHYRWKEQIGPFEIWRRNRPNPS
jgi:hypothetical protein